jgi:hypothetical protein
VFVGTDPNEWWEGFEAFVVEAMRAQAEAMGGGLQIIPGQLQAYREGSVGWSIDRNASFRPPDGTEIPFRNSAVFLQEDGEWKLIHTHTSIGVRKTRGCSAKRAPPTRGAYERTSPLRGSRKFV